MISLKLVRLIEEHSDELTDDLVRKLQSSAQTRSLQRISAADLRRGIHESLCQFHAWLVTRGDHDVEKRYRVLGLYLAGKGVTLADFCWAIVLVKRHPWEFAGQQAFHSSPMEIHAELDLLRFIDLFFDSVICYIAEGYEKAANELGKLPPSPTTTERHCRAVTGTGLRIKRLREGKKHSRKREENLMIRPSICGGIRRGRPLWTI